MEHKYNMKSPAVKRLMREAQELHEATDEYCAQPVEENLFEWHFTVRGPMDSEFEGGIYHGRIILPPEYPMKPPSIILLTPNGRFEVNKKICLSISGHHPESWQPSWSIRTALLAIIGFMPTQGLGAIGSLDYKTEERKALAQRSHEWNCSVCGPIRNLLQNPGTAPRKVNQEARDLAAQISFKGEMERAKESSSFAESLSNSDQCSASTVSSTEKEALTLNSKQEKPNRVSEEVQPLDADSSQSIRHRIQASSIQRVEQVSLHNENDVIINNSSNHILTGAAVFLIVAIIVLIFRRLYML